MIERESSLRRPPNVFIPIVVAIVVHRFPSHRDPATNSTPRGHDAAVSHGPNT